jgi:HTH-type transcriptional regulator/antitoxin HigA
LRLDHENTIKPIRTEKDYDAALKEVERPMDPPHPIEAIKFRMEQQGLTRRDLEPLIGTRTRVAEVLNRRRGSQSK